MVDFTEKEKLFLHYTVVSESEWIYILSLLKH